MSLRKLSFLTLFLFLILFPSSLLAQSTTVTLQVTDADGQTWNNGTWTVNGLVLAGASKFTIVGTNTVVPNQSQTGTLSATGGATFTLTPNASIAPFGSQWSITVCPQATSSCLTSLSTIAGATQTVTLNPSGIRISTTSAPYYPVLAYQDLEVSGPAGAMYFNLTTNQYRSCGTGTCTRAGWSTSVTAATQAAIPTGLTSITEFGDSIGVPVGMPAYQGWGSMLAKVNGYTFTDNSVSGSRVTQNGWYPTALLASPSLTNGNISLGTANDLIDVGSFSTNVATAYEALYIFLALPSSQVVKSASLTTTGTCSQVSQFGQNSTVCTAANSTVTASNVNGTVVYIAGAINTGYDNASTVTIDGVSQGTISFLNPGVNSGGLYPVVFRFGGLSSGNHTVVVRESSASNISVQWVGGNGSGTGLPFEGVGATIPYGPQPAAVGTINGLIQPIITQLKADGLNIAYVADNTPLSLTSFPPTYQDNVHPNSLGDQYIAATWLGYTPPATSVALLQLGLQGPSSGLYNQVLQLNLSSTASVGTTTLYTVPTGLTGTYRYCYYFHTTVAGTGGTATTLIGWTDDTSNLETITSAAISLSAVSGQFTQGCVVMNAQQATNIVYQVNFISPTGTPTTVLYGRLEFLN